MDKYAEKSRRALKKRMETLSDIIDKKRSEFDYTNCKSFAEYEAVAKFECDEYMAISRYLRKTKDKKKIKYNPIPKYGDLFPFEQFKAMCDAGGFIDYDGSGRYATATKESDLTILASDISEGEYRTDFTHVVWYNK